jgi:hypothetical protein
MKDGEEYKNYGIFEENSHSSRDLDTPLRSVSQSLQSNHHEPTKSEKFKANHLLVDKHMSVYQDFETAVLIFCQRPNIALHEKMLFDQL